MPIVAACGTISCSKPSRFASSELANTNTPGALAPGRLRPATRPNRTGSVAVEKTIGIVVVAALAASAETPPPVAMMTATAQRLGVQYVAAPVFEPTQIEPAITTLAHEPNGVLLISQLFRLL